MKNGIIALLVGAVAIEGLIQCARYPKAKRTADEWLERIPTMTEDELEFFLKLNRSIPRLPFDVRGKEAEKVIREAIKTLAKKKADKN